MDKNKIKSYLSSNFLTEAKETADKPVGLKKTEDIQKANKSINAASLKDVAKDIKANDKALTANKTTNAKEVKKRELDKGEKETHDNVELFQDTMLALDYDSPVDDVFKDRFEKSLAGHPTMGNSSEYANVVQDKVWGGDPNFGQSLVDKTKAMAKVQQNVVGGGNTMLPYGVKNGNYAMNESTEMGAENIQWEVKPIKGHSLEKNTHFAIHKQTNAIADSWDLSDRMPRKPKPPIDKSNKRAVSIYKNKMVDYKEQIREFSDDLKLDADYFFYDDLRDGCGANMDKFKKSDFAIVTKDGLLKRGFDLNNYNYFVGQKYGEPENNQEMPMVDNNNNNKPQIKEGMKRLKFKNPFNGLNNALDLIPESYRVDDKEFEMTDGNESYKVRWEGTLTEGRAIVLMGSDKELVNEDIAKIKHLMGYSSEKTLGNLKGNQRLDENKRFADIWGKTKSLLIESEDIDGQDAPEGEWDEETKKAAEATKNVQGSVAKTKNYPNSPAPKHGQFADVKKKATEATKDVEGSVANEKNYPNTPAVKTGEWDKNVKGQAADAKKHIHMHESWMNENPEQGGQPAQTGVNDVDNLVAKLHQNSTIQNLFKKINTKIEIVQFMRGIFAELLTAVPQLASSVNALIPLLKDTASDIMSQPEANTAVTEENYMEEGMYEEKDRFEEIFGGMDEEDDKFSGEAIEANMNEENDLVGMSGKSIKDLHIMDRIIYSDEYSVGIVLVDGWYTALLINNQQGIVIKDVTAARNYDNLLDILQDKYGVGNGSEEHEKMRNSNDDDDDEYDDESLEDRVF